MAQNKIETAETADADFRKLFAAAAEWLHEHGRRKWLLLSGGIGNGKTTTAKAMQKVFNFYNKELIEDIYKPGEYRRQDKAESDFCLYTAKDLAESCRAETAIYEIAFKCENLIIDDVGCEPKEIMNFGNVITPIIDILSHRYDGRLTTILTTNLTMRDILTRYGARILDRIKEMAVICECEGKSLRR